MPYRHHDDWILMKLFAVIHERLHDRNSITLVSANDEQEAKDVYLNHIGLMGMGTQLKVEEIDTRIPSVICTLFEGKEETVQ